MASDNVIDYPLMARQREEEIQQGELARADDVNAEFNSIIDVYNRLVGLLQGEWGGDTGRIYELVDQAVRTANEALTKANGAVLRTGDTMSGQLNQPDLPISDYNLVNKKYVDEKVQDELADPINRITALEGRLDDLNATQVKLENDNFTGKNVNDGMNELFISVSNGKKIIATAITDKGVPTSSDDSFAQMRDNIMSIVTFNEGTAGGTATPEDVIKGKTFFARRQYLTGTYVPLDTSDATATENDILFGKSAYVNGQKVYGTNTGVYVPSGPSTGDDTSDATATAADIAYGKTAYARGNKITGIMQNDLVEEVFTTKENEQYEVNEVAAYVTGKTSPELPEGATIASTGYYTITQGEIYGLSAGQKRIIDFAKVKTGSTVSRYIRARLMDKTSIIFREQGSGEPAEKTLFSFKELGLKPDVDISSISVGIDGFQGRKSHRGLAIVQEGILHIYDYDAAANYVGLDPREGSSYVSHWIVDFPKEETGDNTLINDTRPFTVTMDCAPAWANHQPDICSVAVSYRIDTASYSPTYIVLLNVNTYTEDGTQNDRVYRFYSNPVQGMLNNSLVFSRNMEFSLNDKYIYGAREDIDLGRRAGYFIAAVNTSDYTFLTKNVRSNGTDSAICTFDNDTKCICNGNVYAIAVSSSQINLTPINENGIYPNRCRSYKVTADNKYLIAGIMSGSRADRLSPEVYLIDLAASQRLQPVQQPTSIYFGENSGFPGLVFDINGYFGAAGSSSKLLTYNIGIDTEKISAIRYKGSYWYPTLTGQLTAVPADVAKDKTFIGAIGYPEKGTREGGAT